MYGFTCLGLGSQKARSESIKSTLDSLEPKHLHVTKVKGWSEQQTDKPSVEGNNLKKRVVG